RGPTQSQFATDRFALPATCRYQLRPPFAKSREGWGTCDPSRGCTVRGRAADGRSVTEATMRAGEDVVVQPGGELLVAFFGVGVVADISPLAQSGLDEAFGFAVGAGSVGSGEAMADTEFLAGGAKAVRAIAMSVVGEQAANGDAMLGIERHRGA